MEPIRAPVRSAEKARISTCLFADRIAEVSIEKFRKVCPEILQSAFQQTVLSTIVVENVNSSALRVISLGVGTKFMPTFHCDDDAVPALNHLLCVRDCHAEILARRALLLYIYREMEHLIDDRIHGRSREVVDTSLIEWTRKRSRQHSTRTFKIRDCIRLHMYTSSMPCGNACIKRWAKGYAVKTLPLDATQLPSDIHPPLHITARDQGQVALLVKKGSASIPCQCCNSRRSSSVSNGDSSKLSADPVEEHIKDVSSESWYPPGTFPADKSKTLPTPIGRVMTCSDKIAVWNAVGIQGALLSHMLVGPVYLASITIGRKYSEPHARRALCCRLQDFSFNSSETLAAISIRSDDANRRDIAESAAEEIMPALYSINHPVLMQTAVKLDEGAIITGGIPSTACTVPPPTNTLVEDRQHIACEDCKGKGISISTENRPTVGACFAEKRCVYWSALPTEGTYTGADLGVVIDGETGLLWKADTSPDTTTSHASGGDNGVTSPDTTTSHASGGDNGVVELTPIPEAPDICSAYLLRRYERCVSLLMAISSDATSTSSTHTNDTNSTFESNSYSSEGTAGVRDDAMGIDIRAGECQQEGVSGGAVTRHVRTKRFGRHQGCHSRMSEVDVNKCLDMDDCRSTPCDFSLAKDKLFHVSSKKKLFADWIRTTAKNTGS